MFDVKRDREGNSIGQLLICQSAVWPWEEVKEATGGGQLMGGEGQHTHTKTHSQLVAAVG